MSPNENKALVRRFFNPGPSRGDIRAADELLADDFTLHVPLACSPGIQGMNKVITARGIHKGAFIGLPATGKSITMTGIEIFRIENGRIAELLGEANLLGLMQQLEIIGQQ